MNRLQQFANLAIGRQRMPGLPELETMLDHLSKAALLVDRVQRRILVANAPATELTAYTRTELLELSPNRLLRAESPEEIAPLWDTGSGELELSLLTRSNQQVEILLTTTPLDSDGQWALWILEPQAQRRQRQTETTRQTQRWDSLLNLALSTQLPDLDPALTMALKAGRDLMGGSALAIYQIFTRNPGFHRTSVIGPAEPFPDYVPPVDLSHLSVPYLWTRRKHAGTTLDRAARSAGFEYLASVPLGQPNALLGLLVVAGEETEPSENLMSVGRIVAASVTTTLQNHVLKTNLNAQLSRQRTTLTIGELLKDAVHDGIILLDPKLLILEMNSFAELILGYPANEVQGQHVQNILIGTDNLTAAMRMAQQGIPTHDLGNIRLHSRDGQAFLALVRTLPVVIDGQTERIIILIHDLSEHEEFRVRTQQLEQRALLGEVTAIFAHEVRNPINNITSGLQLMAHNLATDDPHRANFDRLLDDCNRLDHLMTSVLDFSRTTEYKLEPVDLPTLAQRLLDRWRPRMTRVAVEAHPQYAPNTPPVLGDQRALEQVFTNLISNAVQAMSEEGGVLAVKIQPARSDEDRPMVSVTISDTGPGIPDEILERIYEPFFTTNPQGTGLGLAITRRIIYAHKGLIKVNSFPGGTMFQIMLPAVEG